VSRRIEVSCEVDIEQTPESFHAHAIPCGIDIRPGDRVLVHGVPTDIRFGTRLSNRYPATVIRASWLERVVTQAVGLFALAELYEVGFDRSAAP
jgi:hypothetical protein